MLKSFVIPTLATIGSLAMLVSALLSPFLLFSLLGRSPCADESHLYLLSKALVPATLLFSAIWLGRLKWRPNVRGFVIALAVPAVALTGWRGMETVNAGAQRQCEAQTLAQAAVSCRIDPSVYRVSHDPNGYRTLTLFAPGTTDRAWNCMEQWSQYNGSISMKIDETVYQQTRTRAAP